MELRFCSILSDFESDFLSKSFLCFQCFIPRNIGYEAAYTYSSVMFLHPLPCRCLRYQSILPFFFLFVSRYLYADPLHCNMTYLLIRLLKDDLKEYTYAARLSGLVYAIASGMNAILVSKMEKDTGRNKMAWELSAVWKNVGICF